MGRGHLPMAAPLLIRSFYIYMCHYILLGKSKMLRLFSLLAAELLSQTVNAQRIWIAFKSGLITSPEPSNLFFYHWHL